MSTGLALLFELQAVRCTKYADWGAEKFALTVARVLSCLTRLFEKGEGSVDPPAASHLADSAGNCLRDAIRRSRMMPTSLLCTSARWIVKS